MAKKDELVRVKTGPTSGLEMNRADAEAYVKANEGASIEGAVADEPEAEPTPAPDTSDDAIAARAVDVKPAKPVTKPAKKDE